MWWLWLVGVALAGVLVSRCVPLEACVPDPCCRTSVQRVCGAGRCGALALFCCRGVRCGFYGMFVLMMLVVIGAIIKLGTAEGEL